MRSRPDELDDATILIAITGGANDLHRCRARARLYSHYESRVRYAITQAALKHSCRHRIEDLRQEVWRRLFDHGCRLLRPWAPARGPFGFLIMLIAYRQAVRAIRAERGRSVTDADPLPETPSLSDPQASISEAQLIQNDLLSKVLDLAEAELDDDDLLILREVHIRQRSGREVAKEHGWTEDFVYQRTRRLLGTKLPRLGRMLLGTEHQQPDPQAVPANTKRRRKLDVAALLLFFTATPLGNPPLDDRSPPPADSTPIPPPAERP